MKRIALVAAGVVAFLDVSCSRTNSPEISKINSSGIRVAPQGSWSAKPINRNYAVCKFPWLMDIEYREGNITYTEPQVESSPRLVTFSGLDTDSPKIIESDARGAEEVQGFQAFRTEHKVSLVRVSPQEKNLFIYTIDLDSGIAMLTEHARFLLSNDPRGRIAMGTCQ